VVSSASEVMVSLHFCDAVSLGASQLPFFPASGPLHSEGFSRGLFFHPATFFLKPKAGPPPPWGRYGRPLGPSPHLPTGSHGVRRSFEAGPGRPLPPLLCGVSLVAPTVQSCNSELVSPWLGTHGTPPPLRRSTPHAQAPRGVLMSVTYQNRGVFATLVGGGGVTLPEFSSDQRH